jgi:hypothetical protein
MKQLTLPTMQPTIAYKLFKQRKNGTLGPLFINAKQVVPVGKWLTAGDFPTKGYAHRPGWHCCFQPVAPHLAKQPKNGCKRVWCKVEVIDTTTYNRPESQGGAWVLAKYMRVLEVIG